MTHKEEVSDYINSVESLENRHFTIRHPKTVSVLKVQDKIITSITDFLRKEGFVEILAPIIGPATDPGIRGAKQVSIDYYGTPFKLMSSMILYKQMIISSLSQMFTMAPNIRLEPLETIKTGRHLTQFYQADIEKANASYFEMMEIAERLVRHVCEDIVVNCKKELKELNRKLEIPKLPFKRLKYSESIDILKKWGFDIDYKKEISWDAEEALSKAFKEPFFIYDYPKSARGFYDKEDAERPGTLRDFDLIYPDGFGEAISGGEREYTVDKVVERMRLTGEDPENYAWYLEMLRKGIPPSAGFGIGIERLTKFVCGLDKIWEATPFPKVAGIASP